MNEQSRASGKKLSLLDLPPAILRRIFTEEGLRAGLSDSIWRLVQDLVRAMPNLQSFAGVGAGFLRHFFTSPFLELNPFSSLNSLGITLFTSDVLTEPGDEDLIYRLSRINPLRRFTLYIGGIQQPLPLPLLNVPSRSGPYLSPRSWDVEDFFLSAAAWGGPELRHLFSLFSTHLTSVDLTLFNVSPSFANDILLLPPSLTKLILIVGYACPSGCEGGTYPAPSHALTDLASHFPNLTFLYLYGNIVNSSTLLSLSGLSKLATMELGPHAEISAPEILNLFPPTLPLLSQLNISLCRGLHVPVALQRQKGQPRRLAAPSKGNLPTVAWPPAFGPKDAEALLRKAEQAGVDVEGTLRCAVGMCGMDELHQKMCIGDGV